MFGTLLHIAWYPYRLILLFCQPSIDAAIVWTEIYFYHVADSIVCTLPARRETFYSLDTNKQRQSQKLSTLFRMI